VAAKARAGIAAADLASAKKIAGEVNVMLKQEE